MRTILLLIFAAIVPVSAKLPELDAIFYGEVRHNGSQPLVPLSADNIRVIARLNGVTIAQTSVAPGEARFVLKVPKDDGSNPRLPGTARSGERVRVFIRSNALDAEQETVESLTAGGLPISATKGEIVPTPLSVLADFGEATQGIEAWLLAHSLPAGSVDDDSDGDGQCNTSEYAAGTDPTDPMDRFRILEVSRHSGNNFVKFGPIRPGRQYTVWCSETLGTSSWSNIGQVTPGSTGDHFLFGHPTPSASNVFYRLQVHGP
jgi:hypothetical protein